MSSERITWIDVARGTGIIIVLYAHGLNGDGFRYLFYAFHMPLFFFLSGLVFHLKRNETYWSQIYKASRGILYPYLFFAGLSFLIWLLSHPSERAVSTIILHLQGIFYGSGSNGYLPFNTVLWFLPCLFITRVGFTTLVKFIKKERYIMLALFLFSLLGYGYSLLFPTLKLPFGIETAFTAIVFFGSGYLVHEHAQKLTTILRRYLLLIFVITSIICVVFATFNYQTSGHQIDLRLDRLDNYFMFYVSAICGILATIVLSIIIRKNKILEYVGKYSLILFVWHIIIFSYISKFLLLFISSDTINTLRNMYLAPIYTLISIVIILGCNALLSKIRANLQAH